MITKAEPGVRGEALVLPLRDKIPFLLFSSPKYQNGSGEKHFNPTEAFVANRAVAR